MRLRFFWFILVGLFLAATTQVKAMTCIPDPQGLRCWGRLTLEESPYYQTSAINVYGPDTLIFDPGTIVYLTGGWLVARPGGTIIADGAQIVQISGTCGIDIEQDATGTFDNCYINIPSPCGYGNAAILVCTGQGGQGGTLHIHNSTVVSGGETIVNCGMIDSSEVTLGHSPTHCRSFEEGSGSTAADSCGNLTGRVYGDPWTEAGYIGGGMDFDGTTEYVDLCPSANIPLSSSESFTVKFAFKMNKYTTRSHVSFVGTYVYSTTFANWQVTMYPDGHISFSVRGPDDVITVVQGAHDYVDNQWHIVRAIQDVEQNEIALYVDRVLEAGPVALVSSGPYYVSGDTPVRVARRALSEEPDAYYDGWLDELKFYNTAEYPDLCDAPSLSGTLPASGSPYYVDCDLLVPAGDTLVIEPGVVLNFMGPYKFEVQGTLLAEGTEADSIVFTTDTLANPERWRGLRFLGGNGSRLEYCLIQNGRAQGAGWDEINGGGAYCIVPVAFENCVFRRNSAQHGGGGVFCYRTSGVTLSHCDFFDNRGDDCGGGAGFQYGAQGTLDHCVFAGNSGVQFGGGVYHSYSHPYYQNCTFSANNSPQGGALYLDGSSPTVNSCILWQDPLQEIYAVMGSNPNVQYSDVQGGWPGTGNINSDPLFVNASARDFHLQASSLCIDAGDPTMFDPDCTPSDMGAFYFFHLAQPDSLIIQQQGNDMMLRWSVVDSTECGFPSPIQSYVIYYEEELGEDWDFLVAVTDTFYTHENVVLFAPTMFYEVVATDVEIGLIRSLAQPGMSRAEFEAALLRVRR